MKTLIQIYEAVIAVQNSPIFLSPPFSFVVSPLGTGLQAIHFCVPFDRSIDLIAIKTPTVDRVRLQKYYTVPTDLIVPDVHAGVREWQGAEPDGCVRVVSHVERMWFDLWNDARASMPCIITVIAGKKNGFKTVLGKAGAPSPPVRPDAYTC